MGFAIMLVFCGPIFQINNYQLKGDLSFPVAVAGLVILAIGIVLTKNVKLKPFGTAALGLLYISLSWGLAMNLYKEMNIHVHDNYFVMPSRSNMILMIIISIWINDTMAYIVGSIIGKRPLSKISPKKTWEGTIGGMILSIVVVGLIAFFVLNSGAITSYIMLLAAIACVAGTFGDLLESKLKRMAGVKDSGNIMPGHGGFLDRFDSLLLAIPAVWLYVYLVFVI